MSTSGRTASARAIASPMPRLPPVTNTVRANGSSFSYPGRGCRMAP
jgi:hypothetical protein